MSVKMKRCPQCKGEAPVDMPHCPHCPYSWPEEDEAPGVSHSLTPSWSPVPLALLLAAAGLGAIGWLVVMRKGDVIAPQAEKPSPSLYAPRKPIAIEREPEPEAPAPTSGRDTEAEMKYVREQVGLEDEPEVKEWRLRGVVYDLTTLAPVPRCLLVLTQASTGEKFETMTDAGGRYRLLVPALQRDSYQVRLQAERFSRSYLNPEVENVRKLPEAKRRELANELAATFLPPYELTGSAQPLVTDFYLAPQR